MKKTVLSLMLSVALLGGTALTANAADDTPTTSTGTVGFEAGSITIDNGETSAEAANLDFGTHEITAADGDTQEFTNINTSAKVAVQDLRGTAAGWSLGVSQGDQFKTGNSELTGAVLTLKSAFDSANSSTGSNATVNDVELAPNGTTSKPIMTATSGNGNGTSINGIAGSILVVPTNTSKVADKTYETTLTWELNATPDNG